MSGTLMAKEQMMIKNFRKYQTAVRLVGGLLLSTTALLRLKRRGASSEEKQANAYFPVKSDSEEAAGHPLVGAS